MSGRNNKCAPERSLRSLLHVCAQNRCKTQPSVPCTIWPSSPCSTCLGSNLHNNCMTAAIASISVTIQVCQEVRSLACSLLIWITTARHSSCGLPPAVAEQNQCWWNWRRKPGVSRHRLIDWWVRCEGFDTNKFSGFLSLSSLAEKEYFL